MVSKNQLLMQPSTIFNKFRQSKSKSYNTIMWKDDLKRCENLETYFKQFYWRKNLILSVQKKQNTQALKLNLKSCIQMMLIFEKDAF